MEGLLKFLGYFARKNGLVNIQPIKPNEAKRGLGKQTVIYLMILDE